jgi:hypothetical protein
MVLATAIRPEVNRVDDPFGDYYLPLWRADKVAVNTVPFHSGNNDPNSPGTSASSWGWRDGRHCCRWRPLR